MKRMICAVCSAVLVLCLCACSGNTANRTGKNNTKTVTDVLNGNTVSSQNNSSADNSSKVNASGNNSSINNSSVKPTGYVPDGNLSNLKCDVDLTVMNSTMVYAEVNNMLTNPDKYRGKIIKMKGSFSVYETAARNYYACIIADATACCSQGIEFVVANKRKYPNEYPALGTQITVVGKFETYKEGSKMYCQLIGASMA